jgi:hypothetical protein
MSAATAKRPLRTHKGFQKEPPADGLCDDGGYPFNSRARRIKKTPMRQELKPPSSKRTKSAREESAAKKSAGGFQAASKAAQLKTISADS